MDFINNYDADWNLYDNNCVDFLKDALDAAGIPHPDWDNNINASDPEELSDWIKEQPGSTIKNPTQQGE